MNLIFELNIKKISMSNMLLFVYLIGVGSLITFLVGKLYRRYGYYLDYGLDFQPNRFNGDLVTPWILLFGVTWFLLTIYLLGLIDRLLHPGTFKMALIWVFLPFGIATVLLAIYFSLAYFLMDTTAKSLKRWHKEQLNKEIAKHRTHLKARGYKNPY